MSTRPMPHPGLTRFRYSAIDKDRNPAKGTITATDRDAARDILLQRFAHLFSLEEVIAQDWVGLVSGYQDSKGSLPVYTRALAVMFDAGLPMTRTFEVVAQGEDLYLNKVMLDVADSLRQGRSLSMSLARWKTVFDPSFIGMCRAAEKSGRLHHTLKSLATMLEKRWRLSQRLKAALTYPILVGVVALLIFWILVAVVVPSLVPTFKSLGVKLPWPTKVLVALGDFSTSIPVVLAGAVAAMIGLGILYRVTLRGEYFPGLHLWWDQLRLRIPVAGELLRLAILSRTLSTMAALIESGLPLASVLDSAGQVSGSPVYQRHFVRVLADITEGRNLAEAMDATGGFPPLLVGIAALGEESGKLPTLLVKAADLYAEDLDHRLANLNTLLEPILLGFMGLVIGFIVLGTFLPLINLVQQL